MGLIRAIMLSRMYWVYKERGSGDKVLGFKILL